MKVCDLMPVKIPWDKYEAAILLDAWLKVKEGIPKMQMINLVSFQLRQKAVNQGIEIDNIFRNTNGISFQLMSMATAYEQKNMGKPAAKLFTEIAELYRNDYQSYKKILKEAMRLAEYSSDTKDSFLSYVSQKQPKSATDILNAVKCMENFAISTKALSHSIYENLTEDTINILRKKVLKHKFFTVRFKSILQYAELSLQMLSDYITKKTSILTDEQASAVQSTLFVPKDILAEFAKKCNETLMQEFEDGYCIGDYMHRMRFQSAYEEMYGEKLDKDGDELDSLLKNIGQIRDDRIFYVNTDNNTLLSAIYADIVKAFDNGATAVYYECLYEKYSDKLAKEMSIYGVDALKSVMINDNKFFLPIYQFERSAITKRGVDADTNLEIRQILQENHVPITTDYIKSKLWYIPNDRIKLALVQIPEAAHVGEATYFYAPNFYISAEEKIALICAMRSVISSKGYLVAKNLREIFRNACPSAAMDSEHFKDYSIREILKVLLREEFEFSSSVITKKGNQLDYGQVFQNYAAEREHLTLSELQELKKELGSPVIYWDSVFKEMIRISATELVRKGTVQFNVAAIDEVLEQMCPSEYTALKDIDLFLSFPPVNVRWNGFVLESYLREYSEKFRLIQLSIAQDDYFGVMLKRSSNLKNYDDVAVDMLARNESWSDEKSALRLLVDMKFQPRAKKSNIAVIIKAAKQKRLNLK